MPDFNKLPYLLSSQGDNYYCPLVGCVDIDYDLTGFDLEVYPHPKPTNWNQCQIACERQPECYFWTWDPTKTPDSCFFKNQMAIQGRKEKSLIISGTKFCSSNFFPILIIVLQ